MASSSFCLCGRLIFTWKFASFFATNMRSLVSGLLVTFTAFRSHFEISNKSWFLAGCEVCSMIFWTYVFWDFVIEEPIKNMKKNCLISRSEIRKYTSWSHLTWIERTCWKRFNKSYKINFRACNFCVSFCHRSTQNLQIRVVATGNWWFQEKEL